VWNTRVAILTQCKEAEDPRYRSWYSHPLKTERFGFRTQVDVIYFLRFTPVLKVPGTHPAFYILGTEAFPHGQTGRGVPLTTHPYVAQRLEKVDLYLYSPSVPEIGCYVVTVIFIKKVGLLSQRLLMALGDDDGLNNAGRSSVSRKMNRF